MNTANIDYANCLRETDAGKQAEAMLTEKTRTKIGEQQRQRAIKGNKIKIEALRKEKLAHMQSIETDKQRITDSEKAISDCQITITYSQDRISQIDAYIDKLKQSNRFLQSN